MVAALSDLAAAAERRADAAESPANKSTQARKSMAESQLLKHRRPTVKIEGFAGSWTSQARAVYAPEQPAAVGRPTPACRRGVGLAAPAPGEPCAVDHHGPQRNANAQNPWCWWTVTLTALKCWPRLRPAVDAERIRGPAVAEGRVKGRGACELLAASRCAAADRGWRVQVPLQRALPSSPRVVARARVWSSRPGACCAVCLPAEPARRAKGTSLTLRPPAVAPGRRLCNGCGT